MLKEYKSYFLDSLDGDICDILERNRDTFLQVWRKNSEMEVAFAFENRQVLYETGFGVPRYVEDSSIKDKDLQYFNKIHYYCQKISDGILRKGLIVTFQKLQSYLNSFEELLVDYKNLTRAELDERIQLWEK